MLREWKEHQQSRENITGYHPRSIVSSSKQHMIFYFNTAALWNPDYAHERLEWTRRLLQCDPQMNFPRGILLIYNWKFCVPTWTRGGGSWNTDEGGAASSVRGTRTRREAGLANQNFPFSPGPHSRSSTPSPIWPPPCGSWRPFPAPSARSPAAHTSLLNLHIR